MSSKSIVCAVVLLLLIGVNAGAQAQKPPSTPTGLKVETLPDLVVVSIDFKNYKVSPNPDGTQGASVLPGFTYKNQGPTGTGPFNVTWEYWDYGTKSWGRYLGQYFTNTLAAGQSWTEGGKMVDEFIFTPGANPPRFRVQLDTGHTVAESNENNNTLEKEFKPIIAAPIPSIKKIIK
jgi:hypothetical protein